MTTLAKTLIDWLHIDSISGNEWAFLTYLEEYFQTQGWQTERQPISERRFNLLATTGKPPKLLYCTHVDTVPPVLDVRQDGERIYGRGACDTKGGLLAMVEAAEALRKEGLEEIGFLLVVGEEVDHCGAKASVDLALTPERIILCEPTQNQVVQAQKGMLKFALQTSGVAGHSAYVDRGTSAINPLLDALEILRNHDFPKDDILGPTTLNIGTIQGGVAANVFAPQARAEILIRAVSPVEALLAEIRALLPAEVSLMKPVYNDPIFFDPPEGLKTCTVPFNTDASYLSQFGPVWLVGPGDIRVAHGDNEHIDLPELTKGIHLYTELGRLVLSE